VANERLRAQMAERGVTIDALSEHIGVDRKTVERWITSGRSPHRTHRMKAAALLGRDEAYIWPGAVSERQMSAASEAELVALYPNRGSVPVDLWCQLIEQAEESIDLLAYAGSFLHDAIPDFAERLAARARAGVRVRLLLGDPESDAVALRGEEERIGALMAARCNLTWAYFAELLSVPGVEARKHSTTLYNSIYRFDSIALVNSHAYGAPASQSPMIQFQRVSGGRVFDHYLASFDRVWETGIGN